MTRELTEMLRKNRTIDWQKKRNGAGWYAQDGLKRLLTSFFSFFRVPESVLSISEVFAIICVETFLMKVYRSEPNKQYFHFGDIDAGGFYIFDDLCEKTGIPFQPLSMDMDTLYSYKSYWKELTKNDVTRCKR